MSDGSDHEIRLARLRHKYALEYEMVRAMAAFEHAALRPLFALNGGGLIAFFTLYGALARAGNGPPPFARGFMLVAIASWISGLLFGSVSIYCAARSQFAFRKLRSAEVELEELSIGLPVQKSDVTLNRSISELSASGQTARRVSIFVGFGSLIAFLSGIIWAFFSVPA